MSELAEKVSERLRRSQSLRLLVLGFLVLVLLVPIAMIGGKVWERRERSEEAIAEVSGKWGGEQRVTGPVLTVPYEHRWVEKDRTGREIERIGVRRASFLPEALDVKAVTTVEMRQRGIFSVPVYRLTLEVSGRMARPDLEGLGIAPEGLDWSRARLVVGLSDVRAVQSAGELRWGESRAAFEPGNAGLQDVGAGMHAAVEFPPQPAVDFAYSLVVNGSRGLRFTPFGKQTEVTLRSNYPHPSFQGVRLPQHREVSAGGFEARWQVPHLGRSYPQAWAGEEDLAEEIEKSGFGVDFIDPVDHYRMAERSVKYAGLFVLLTFAALWLFEVRAGLRIHPIQYLMVGAALCLFYLLELSLSEHIAFPLAFVIASLAVVGMVIAYGFTVLRSWGRALGVGAGVALLYVYLYVLLTNEDYALLVGSIGLFVILGLIMFATRRVDWYGTKPQPAQESAPQTWRA